MVIYQSLNDETLKKIAALVVNMIDYKNTESNANARGNHSHLPSQPALDIDTLLSDAVLKRLTTEMLDRGYLDEKGGPGKSGAVTKDEDLQAVQSEIDHMRKHFVTRDELSQMLYTPIEKAMDSPHRIALTSSHESERDSPTQSTLSQRVEMSDDFFPSSSPTPPFNQSSRSHTPHGHAHGYAPPSPFQAHNSSSYKSHDEAHSNSTQRNHDEAHSNSTHRNHDEAHSTHRNHDEVHNNSTQRNHVDEARKFSTQRNHGASAQTLQAIKTNLKPSVDSRNESSTYGDRFYDAVAVCIERMNIQNVTHAELAEKLRSIEIISKVDADHKFRANAEQLTKIQSFYNERLAKLEKGLSDSQLAFTNLDLKVRSIAARKADHSDADNSLWKPEVDRVQADLNHTISEQKDLAKAVLLNLTIIPSANMFYAAVD
jgi:hypothetical protein